MKLYSYIVRYDKGFAPNPFWGFCTLACCKPGIRKAVGKNYQPDEDYWIVGLSPKAKSNKVIYAMKVSEVLGFDEYFNNKKYEVKKPDFEKKEPIYRTGDNIYQPLGNGNYKQLRSLHSKNFNSEGWEEDSTKMTGDTNCEYVLISNHFYYFGSKAEELPDDLKELIVGRNYRCNFRDGTKLRFLNYIREYIPKKYRKGVNAPPSEWNKKDTSWKQFL